jgi:hypothetical protein
MKYRVIDDDEELIVLTEDGSIATIRKTDEVEEGDGRQSTVEWYDVSITDMDPCKLQQVIACKFEDLPKYLNEGDELVQEVLKARLNGDVHEDISYYIWDWLGNNSNIYYHDSKLDFKDASLIDRALDELIGTPAADNERDDTIFKKYFDFE